MVDSPGFLLFLLVVILFQLGIILMDKPENILLFRDFVDAIVLLAFIISIYFIFEYLRAKKNMPPRNCPIQAASEDSKRLSKEAQ